MRPTDKPQAQQLPHRDLATGNQINMLLQLLHGIYPALMKSRGMFDDSVQDTGIPKDAKFAAEVTFIKITNCIDEILADKDRWDLKFQRALEDKYNEAIGYQAAFMKAQAEASQNLSRPSYRYKPQVSKLGNGNFIAFTGYLSQPDTVIGGIGKSPMEALEAYDEFFKTGQVDAEMQKFLEQREQALTIQENLTAEQPPQNIPNEDDTTGQ